MGRQVTRYVVVSAAVVGSLVVQLLGQTPAIDKPLTFEVASVKLNTQTNGPQNVQLSPSGLLTVVGLRLRDLVQIVYGSDAIQTPGQLVGLPSWALSDRFDISAKAEGAVADEQGRPTRIIAMLRSLLEERFQLKVHNEMREVPIYALVLANKEPKFGTLFKVSTANCCSRESPPPKDAPPDPARLCGIRGGNGNVTYVATSMQQIARSFANYPVVGRPVMDRTGLQGTYDLHMEFTPAFVDSPTGNGSQIANPAADSGPNLFTAVVEQAGLKLQGERGMVEFLVIDHVERPSAD
jgi:uncharacterized protein (TIGR03435 family)